MMRVLVTRPALSGTRTAKKLEVRGHEALLLPLATAVHHVVAVAVALDATTGAIAVTSAETIRGLQSSTTPLALHLQRPLFAVGKTTGDKARDAGFTTVRHSRGGGADLADLVAGERSLLGDQPLLYLAGFPRSPGFEAGLSAHGIAFSSVESYRMDPLEPPPDELQRTLGARPVDAILFYSSHSAERFFGLDFVTQHSDQLKNTRLLCLSATIATIVPYALRSQVEIASVPEEDSLLALLDTDASANLI